MIAMDLLECLQALSAQMDLEPAEDMGCIKLSTRQQSAVNIGNALLPNGKRVSLLKTLLTSACERNCYYCPFRSGRDFRRVSLKPDEMARTFALIHRTGVVQGIFLSSGIAGGSLQTQDQLLATAEILRTSYNFQGYIHLKLMPGVERSQVERAMQLADRVSLNLEAPNDRRLQKLAPRKTFLDELLRPLRWVSEIRQSSPPHHAWKGRWPSLTTQFVVGAVEESDLELLTTTAYLHKNLQLARAYFSAFQPISDTPFADLPATSPRRELHLYQASFLIRDYGFELEELPFGSDGSLPEHADPKTAWALEHLRESPVEINSASRQDLLRIPGFGPKSVQTILAARKQAALRNPEDLRKLGVNPTRALPFILLDGKQAARQLPLL